MDKEKKKILRRKVGWVLLNFVYRLVDFFPCRVVLYFGRVFGSLGYVFSARHRRVALESLNYAFSKDKSPSEIKRIARESFKIIGEASWELLYFVRNLKCLKERVEIVGLENLKEALKKKKGVLGLTAHFGNFPVLCMKLQDEGFKVNVMLRPMRDKNTAMFFDRMRAITGVKTILSYPRKVAIYGVLNALKNNELVVMHMDQNFGTGGIWVKFFGKLAATSVGHIILGLRADAAVVPMYIVRKSEGRHSVVIENEIKLERLPDKEETLLVNAIKLTAVIEMWIRQYPALWGWIHRRWKSRPSAKVYEEKFKVQKD